MKIWHSIYHRTAYSGNEPSFYQTNQFDWSGQIEKNWKIIRDELERHLASKEASQRINNHGRWKTMPLKTWGIEFHKNIQNFPLTMELLNRIPGLVSVSFNLLEKGSQINQHFGETNASIRVHLGLKIPNSSDLGIMVNDKTRIWEEGKLLAFCDGHNHTAWNYSHEDRYILLLDIIRPEFMKKRRSICSSVLATLSLQNIETKTKPDFYLTAVPMIALHSIARIAAAGLTPIHNVIGRSTFKPRSDNANSTTVASLDS